MLHVDVGFVLFLLLAVAVANSQKCATLPHVKNMQVLLFSINHSSYQIKELRNGEQISHRYMFIDVFYNCWSIAMVVFRRIYVY